MTEPQFCGGIDWTAPRWYDPWRCFSVMTEYSDADAIIYMCAASHDHDGDHCCTEGHRWPQRKPRWRSRFRRGLHRSRP